MNAYEETKSNHTRPVDRNRLERIEALLQRYPGLTDGEIEDVLLFLRKGPALEIGLLTGNEALRPQLDRFRADHRGELSIGAREIAAIAAIVALLIVAVALLWDFGVGK